MRYRCQNNSKVASPMRFHQVPSHHEGCHSDLLADFLHFGASEFPSKNSFKKCFKIVFFFALASRSGFGATISDAVARSSIVFCNSVSADRIVMAASRLLRAVAA